LAGTPWSRETTDHESIPSRDEMKDAAPLVPERREPLHPLSVESDRDVILLESLKLSPSYSTTTSTLSVIFWTGRARPRSEPRMLWSSSPEKKYWIASVRSSSVVIGYTSPSSSVYAR
jgi:hypothetical protein